MADTKSTGAQASFERRHPRLVQVTGWLRRHPTTVGLVAAVLILTVFFLDATVHPIIMSGFYLVPLTLLALAARERLVAGAGVVCGGLSVLIMEAQGTFTTSNAVNLFYGVLAGLGLIILAYLIRRLSTISDYATLRAQLSEAGADILTSGGTRDDLDELLQYSLERLGEQLDATGGAVLLLEDGAWEGRAGFGLGVDARLVAAPYDALPLAAEALRAPAATERDLSAAGGVPLAPLAAHLRLERVLLVPMRALERDVGVLVCNRPELSGAYDEEQVSLAETIARYLAIAVDNVRLMLELSAKRHDLEMVRDASLEFARSVNLTEVLEVVVTRLLDALAMHACDVYAVDLEAGTLRLLVSFDDQAFEGDGGEDHDALIAEYASRALAVEGRRPVVIATPGDPRLNARERALLEGHGHVAQLTIPLRIRDRVVALVDLFDDRERTLGDEEIDLALTMCRFAALAMDKALIFDELRTTAERRDRLARRLQRLQSFAVGLNRRLDRAELQEVLDEVTAAALDLLRVRCAAVVSGGGEYLTVRSFALGGADDVARRAAEDDLVERCRPALGARGDGTLAGAELITTNVAQSDGLLFAPLEAEAPPQRSVLVVADKLGGEFDDEDRLLVATLAAQLSASLHNASAYQREHAIAETFQQALLMEPPPIPGLEVGVRYRAATDAARVGGDFYDLVMLGPGRLMVIVGDVCGKSLSAAAQSAVVRYMLRAYAAEGSPGEALSRLNSAVIAQTPNQPFVTLVVAYIDVARHMFEYAVAGHPRPLVLAGHGEFPVPGEGNVPVGVFRGAVYPTNRAVLPDDSCLVFYTDGMTDARQGVGFYGEERLKRLVSESLSLPAQALADALLEDVKDFAGGVLGDDCAVVTVKLP